MSVFYTSLTALALLGASSAYELRHNYDATNFLDPDNFHFYTGWDKFTKGFANYVPIDEAMGLGMANITNGKIRLGVDADNSLDTFITGEGSGRKSIRLEGMDTIDNGLVIADMDHLPAGGCGQWPALWLLRDGLTYSEIDIIEGVSHSAQNSMTLWTKPEVCIMKDVGGTGKTRTLDCAWGPESPGCGVDAQDGTFGNSFNSNGGGIWATQLESDGIKIWFFPRGSEPADYLSGKPDPSLWGLPIMNFAPDNCDMKMFQKMKIVINVSFCGAFAGGDAWSGYTKCAATTGVDTCQQYVATNPGAFKDVYFEINSIKVFQKNANQGRDDSIQSPPFVNGTAPWINGTTPWTNGTIPSNETVPGNETTPEPEVSPSPTPVILPGNETSPDVSVTPTPTPVLVPGNETSPDISETPTPTLVVLPGNETAPDVSSSPTPTPVLSPGNETFPEISVSLTPTPTIVSKEPVVTPTPVEEDCDEDDDEDEHDEYEEYEEY